MLKGVELNGTQNKNVLNLESQNAQSITNGKHTLKYDYCKVEDLKISVLLALGF